MAETAKPGSFYLGKVVNPANRELEDAPLFFESKNLTTHAVCVGMTGSGKTGLGIALLEEIALNRHSGPREMLQIAHVDLVERVAGLLDPTVGHRAR